MTAHDGARADARKRHEVAEAAEVATGATNSPEVGNRTSGPEIGAQGVEAIRARLAQADHCREYGSIDSLGISLADDVRHLLAELDRLTTALAAERVRVARVEALAERWERDPGIVVQRCLARLRAALVVERGDS